MEIASPAGHSRGACVTGCASLVVTLRLSVGVSFVLSLVMDPSQSAQTSESSPDRTHSLPDKSAEVALSLGTAKSGVVDRTAGAVAIADLTSLTGDFVTNPIPTAGG